MATAYLFFAKPFNPDTATNLIQATRVLLSEAIPIPVAEGAPPQFGGPAWDTMKISIASGGGDIIAAFAAYNELMAMPVTLHTHNAGAVDSAAIVPFMLGERRTASAASAFFFHQLQWTFASNQNLTATVISDATKWLGTYEDMMAKIVADRSGIPKADVLKMMREGTTVVPARAKALGLIHEIEENAIPHNARTWQV